MREIVLCVNIVTIIAAWYIMIKNIITRINFDIISCAIHAYNTDVIWKRIDGEKVSYDDMMGYCKAVFRFWDWGYKNILPKDKYELIKDYIKR